MKNSTWIATVSLAVLGMVVYTFFPNRPALLGQWTVITEGNEVSVIGHDVSVTLTEENYVPPLDIDYRGYMNRKFDFRVGDAVVQVKIRTMHETYYFRYFSLGNGEGSTALVNVSDVERQCPKIKNASRHVGCYMHLMRHYDDITYCHHVILKSAPYAIANCYWS